jgi:hypothetical protein
MLVANELQEKLDRCMVAIQSIGPAVFTVQLQQILLRMLFSRQFTLPKNVDQLIEILTVTRLVQR